MLETSLPLIAALVKLSQSVKTGVFPTRNISRQQQSSLYNSSDFGSESRSLYLRPPVCVAEGLRLFVRAQGPRAAALCAPRSTRTGDVLVNLAGCLGEQIQRDPSVIMQKRGLKGVQMRLQEDRSRDAAVASRQRLKLTGKAEKPICAMESEAAGVGRPPRFYLLLICLQRAVCQAAGDKSFLQELPLPPSPSATQPRAPLPRWPGGNTCPSGCRCGLRASPPASCFSHTFLHLSSGQTPLATLAAKTAQGASPPLLRQAAGLVTAP